jgi:hypothetical protein
MSEPYEFSVRWHLGGYVNEPWSTKRVENHIYDLLDHALDTMENNIIGRVVISTNQVDVWRPRTPVPKAPEPEQVILPDSRMWLP